MSLESSLGRALKDAYRACSTLYNPEIPLPTSLLCIKQVSLETSPMGVKYYRPIDKGRNPLIHDSLVSYVKTLDARSVPMFVESEYLSKYFVPRNEYVPDSLRQQGNLVEWYLGGQALPPQVKKRLAGFWESIVPKNYKVLSPSKIPCTKYDASGGVCMIRTDTGTHEWAYVKKGPYWSNIQLGTEHWLDLVVARTPSYWIDRPFEALIKDDVPNLEALAVERPVIRTESGIAKCRWARSSSGNVYILGRMIMQPVQNGSWHDDFRYIGIGRNTQLGALRSSMKGLKWRGTHGDDWVAWCPHCGRFHSGDWSNYDLHVTAHQLLAAYETLYTTIKHQLDEREKKLFYANAYFGIKTPTIWLWDREGNQTVNVFKTLGHVRSGSGDFIMLNNGLNNAMGGEIFDQTHERIARIRDYPCRSKLFWTEHAKIAQNLAGWVAKPSAQFTHPHGFIACRCAHEMKDAFIARPSVTSVIRNFVNPAYNPEEPPNGTIYYMAARFLDVNKTLAWAGDQKYVASLMDVLVDVASKAGVEDPIGVELDSTALGRAITEISGLYSTRSYLEGGISCGK